MSRTPEKLLPLFASECATQALAAMARRVREGYVILALDMRAVDFARRASFPYVCLDAFLDMDTRYQLTVLAGHYGQSWYQDHKALFTVAGVTERAAIAACGAGPLDDFTVELALPPVWTPSDPDPETLVSRRTRPILFAFNNAELNRFLPVIKDTAARHAGKAVVYLTEDYKAQALDSVLKNSAKWPRIQPSATWRSFSTR